MKAGVWISVAASLFWLRACHYQEGRLSGAITITVVCYTYVHFTKLSRFCCLWHLSLTSGDRQKLTLKSVSMSSKWLWLMQYTKRHRGLWSVIALVCVCVCGVRSFSELKQTAMFIIEICRRVVLIILTQALTWGKIKWINQNFDYCNMQLFSCIFVHIFTVI